MPDPNSKFNENESESSNEPQFLISAADHIPPDLFGDIDYSTLVPLDNPVNNPVIKKDHNFY